MTVKNGARPMGRQGAGTSGPLHAVVAYPGGLIALWLVAIGFAEPALWRLAEVAYGQAPRAS